MQALSGALLPLLLNAIDAEGRTALMLAAARNHAGAVRVMLHAGADRYIRDRDSKTAFVSAYEAGLEDVVNEFHSIIVSLKQPAGIASGVEGSSEKAMCGLYVDIGTGEIKARSRSAEIEMREDTPL